MLGVKTFLITLTRGYSVTFHRINNKRLSLSQINLAIDITIREGYAIQANRFVVFLLMMTQLFSIYMHNTYFAKPSRIKMKLFIQFSSFVMSYITRLNLFVSINSLSQKIKKILLVSDGCVS